MGKNLDRRKIKDVQNITSEQALKKIAALQPVRCKHIDESPTDDQIGFIAQDFAAVFPQLVRKRDKDDGVGNIKVPQEPKPGKPNKPVVIDDDPVGPTDPIGFQITTYEDLIPMLVGAIKRLNEKLEQLEARPSTVDAQIEALDKRIQNLENPPLNFVKK